MPEPPRDKPRTRAVRQGAAAAWIGLRILCRHPSLWIAAALPVALNGLISGLAIVSFAALGWLHAGTIHPWLRAQKHPILKESLAVGGMLIAAIAAVFALCFALQNVLCHRWYGRLAHRVESALGLDATEFHPLPAAWRRAETIDDVRHLAIVALVGLSLNCVPFLGALLALPVLVLFMAVVTGKELISIPVGIRGQGRDEVITFLERDLLAVLGLGATTLILALIPGLGALLLTTTVVGVVALHRNLDSAGGLRTGARHRAAASTQDIDRFEG